MAKLISIFVMFFVFLASGYVGGAAFSFIFVILGYKLASIISFVVGALAGIIFALILSYIILFKCDEHISEKYSEIWKIQRSHLSPYKPSRN